MAPALTVRRTPRRSCARAAATRRLGDAMLMASDTLRTISRLYFIFYISHFPRRHLLSVTGTTW